MSQHPARCESDLDPLEVERLVEPDKRRISVEEHESFRESIAPPAKPAVDPIDEFVEELRRVERPSK